MAKIVPPKYLINIHTNPKDYIDSKPLVYEFSDEKDLNLFLEKMTEERHKAIKTCTYDTEYGFYCMFYCTDLRKYIDDFGEYCYCNSYNFEVLIDEENCEKYTCTFDLYKKNISSLSMVRNELSGDSAEFI